MNESRIKKTEKNFIYAIIFQISKMVLVFINRIVFVRILGAEYLGINGLFSNILSVLSVADLGITTAMMYSLYKPLANDDKGEISKYINYYKKIYNIIALVIIIFGLLLMPFLKYIVNLPENNDNVYLYYFVLLLNTTLTYLYVYKTTLLHADQKMYIISKYDTLFQFIMFFLQIIILIFMKSFLLYLICNLVCTLLGNYFKVRKTEQLYPYLKGNKSLTIGKKEKKNIFRNVKSLFIYKIGDVIQTNTDNILISIFVGTITVGYYSNYSTIILIFTSFITLVFNAMKASLGNYVNCNDKNKQYEMFNLLETYNYWLVAFCSICFIELIPAFIKICFGQEYVMNDIILYCAVGIFYVQNIRQTIWMYREVTGLFNETKYFSLVTSSLNLILSIILGKNYGIIGILVATIISSMVYSWWKEPVLLFSKYFKKSSKTYFYNYISRFCLLFLIFIVCNFINRFINIGNLYVYFIVKAIITVFVFLVVFLVVYRNSYEFEFLKKILERKKKDGKQFNN